jgi:hypothetical protein
MHVPPSSLLRAVKSYMTHPMALLLNPEKRRGQRRGVAGERKALEKEKRWRKKCAGERKALEKEMRWRKKCAGGKEGPEKRSGQRNILERKGLFGVPGSRNGFLVCARLIPPKWPHLRRAVCLGHLSWAYLACQEISPPHPPPAGTTLLSVPLSSALSLTRTSLLSLFPPRGLVLGHFPPNSFVLSGLLVPESDPARRHVIIIIFLLNYRINL